MPITSILTKPIFILNDYTVPPISNEKIVKRTSKVLVTEGKRRRQTATNLRRLDPSMHELGCHTPAHVPYREFGTVQTDPRDMFVENLQDSLPKIVSTCKSVIINR